MTIPERNNATRILISKAPIVVPRSSDSLALVGVECWRVGITAVGTSVRMLVAFIQLKDQTGDAGS